MTEAEMLAKHIDLVRHIAGKFRHVLIDVEFEDVVQEGCLGLIHAHRRFDPASGNTFVTYAYPCIRGYILRFLNRQNRGLIRLPDNVRSSPIPVASLEEDLFERADPAAAFEDRMVERERIARMLSTLPPRTAEMIRRRYGLDADEEETLSRIGERFGLSKERARQIIQEGIRKMQAAAQSERFADL